MMGVLHRANQTNQLQPLKVAYSTQIGFDLRAHPVTSVEKSKVAVSWLGLLAAIGGGVLGFIQYFDRIEESRVLRTLEFLNRFNDSSIQAAREEANKVWLSRVDDVARILSQPQKPQDEIDAEWNKFVDDTITENGLEFSVRVLIGFYEELGICTKREICDPDTVYELFGRNARAFYNRNLPYIERLRSSTNNPRIAEKLKYVIEKP